MAAPGSTFGTIVQDLIPKLPENGEETKAATLHEKMVLNEKHSPDFVESHTKPSSFPDGGVRAWLVVSGYALVFLPAVIIGRLFDVGWFKVPFAIGTAGLVLSTFLIAQCQEYWQFVLAQGVLVGLSCGICFGPVIGIIGHWFHRRRGLVLAINAAGSSVGGTVIPIVARQLIPKVGAVAVGVPEDFSFYLVSIANASSGLGRVVSGIIVDKLGPVNVSVPFTVAAALVTYLWPLAHTKSVMIAVAIVYGFTSAAYVSTFQMPAYALGDIEDVGRRAGLVMTFAAFGAIAGPPISGAINQASGGFSAVGYYAGELECLLFERLSDLRKMQAP
ncbi:hypothetical protein H0H87_005513 [Tephrocybe sp. NHM501043]|nr:hypothetical protein H0H87_005513 [Tephrocybe sp. NHM501043]